MVRLCTYMLLLALTLQSFYRSIMTIEYQIHLPNYLAKCINKDRPQLHCDGQCVLMQKIKEKEKKETTKNLLIYEYSSLYVHKENMTYRMYQPQEEIRQENFSPYLIGYAFNYHTTLLRPPIG